MESEYKLILEDEQDKFNATITQHLKDGWVLFGSPSVQVVKRKRYFLETEIEVNDTIFSQALIKTHY